MKVLTLTFNPSVHYISGHNAKIRRPNGPDVCVRRGNTQEIRGGGVSSENTASAFYLLVPRGAGRSAVPTEAAATA